jgi:NAD(P)-dependent dehydrogenase (short-subunit alcohol dehydrogenase family)
MRQNCDRGVPMAAHVRVCPSKAALIKLTETLAEETREYGVSAFSVDPGLLRIGLSEAALSSAADPQTPEGQISGWIRGRLLSGHGTDPAQAVRLVLTLAAGHSTGCPVAT